VLHPLLDDRVLDDVMLGDDTARRPTVDHPSAYDRRTVTAEATAYGEHDSEQQDRRDDDQQNQHEHSVHGYRAAGVSRLQVMSPKPAREKPSLTVCAGAVVRDRAGRLLLVRRGHEPSKGLWSVPGGRVEPDETPAQAAVREVREETGLEVVVGSLLASVEVGDFLVYDYAAEVVGGELRAGDDASDVRWCSFDEAALLPLTPGLLDELSRMLAT
jgi:8-oxo-dGTP diphosphatase